MRGAEIDKRCGPKRGGRGTSDSFSSEWELNVDTCEAFDEFDNLDRRLYVGVIQMVERSQQQAGCIKKDSMKLALWSFGGDDTASTPALPAVDHSSLGSAAGNASFDLPPIRRRPKCEYACNRTTSSSTARFIDRELPVP